MTLAIRPLTQNDFGKYEIHFKRHRAESGLGEGGHFLPFAPDDADGPGRLAAEALQRPLTQCGWQRWFVAFSDDGSAIVGHVNLKGDELKTSLHRCELGIGIEGPYRGQGLGTRLMETAIEFARNAPSITWLDLRVFAHNIAARRLYRKMGFVEVGVVLDRFRIEGESIDDATMTLDVSSP